ncbi:MAG TPA: nickel pincer cofactor biosynthesis protein LarC [Ktedonobacterales bacterium]
MLAYLDCFSGISGDMLLGALLDAGMDLAALRAALSGLPLGGFEVAREAVSSHGLHGTRALVRLTDGEEEHAHRTLAEIEAVIRAGGLSATAEAHALAVFCRLAEAEGRVHQQAPEAVTFHEVGAVDSIADITGVAVGLDLLGVTELYCSELPLSAGQAPSAHGLLPVPAPAVYAVLEGTDAIWRDAPGGDAAWGELVTPTGAAIVATLARFHRPARMRVRQVGYGFGRRELPWANCLRLVLAETTEPAGDFERDEVTVIESNIDSVTGEALGWLAERLLAAGALDVTLSPLSMKKFRPATQLTVIARPAEARALAELIVRESGTLGVRMGLRERLIATRREEVIETPLGPMRVKLKLAGERILSVAPEYEDCRAAAAANGLPVEVVMERVRLAARHHFGVE